MSERCHGSHFRFLVLPLLAVSYAGCSQPRGFYVVPEHRDLGAITDDSLAAVAEFEVVNGLDRPVTVKHIYPSCKCTSVALLKNPIPPGEAAILRVTADLSKRSGRQDFSVMLLTDSSAFPAKRVSFTVLARATGTRQRLFSLGSFYPGSDIDVQVPAATFARGVLENLGGSNKSSDISVHFAEDPDGKTVLYVKGIAPHAVGAFSRKFRFRESFPKKPLLGEGIVELELMGKVVARWDVERDLYAGLISLNKDGRIISLRLNRNPTSVREEPGKRVSSVSVACSEGWLSMNSQSVSLDRIELSLRIHDDKLEHLGAIQTAMELTINYTDGDVERYSTNVFAYIGH